MSSPDSVNPNRKFPSEEHIKSKKLFDQLFESGKSIRNHPFRIVWLELPFNVKSPVLAGVSVPKRNMQKAVSRNRMKRILREAYRLNKDPLIRFCVTQQKGFAILFIAQCNEPLSFHDTQDKIILLLQRLIRVYAEPAG